MPGFGGGLSYCAHVVRWGERTSPHRESDVDLPPNERSALQIVRDLVETKKVLTNQEPS
jgi:3-oxoacyl-[acyl-carrier-protein] synthase-3